MSSALPEVSVVIPAFNAERTLGAQLQALSRQNVPFAWEIVVCDNGSTDGTAALVRGWADRLAQLVLVDASARRGAGAARNIGVSAARSALIAFCDADDIVSDDWLREMRNALRSSTLVAGANDYLTLHSSRDVAISRSDDSLITLPYWPQFQAAGAGNLGISADVFVESGGFDETLPTGEDVDLCWRVQLAGYTITRCTSAIAYIRKRQGLIAVFRQAYSYAQGHRMLREKYARLIDDYWLNEKAEAPASSGAATEHNKGGGGRAAARLTRLLRPNGLANAAWRAGEWWGNSRRPTGQPTALLELPPD